ncbi:MAG: release factor glutamine methyltransferase [Cyclobacteriaceae bacterium]|nr:MAG: release factor glutamine methyltransferase [Cyclobacteriaceae bacterium]
MNSQKLIQQTIGKISLPENPDEIREMAFALLEHTTQLPRAALLAGKEISGDSIAWLREAVERLNRGEPVQYITETAWYYGRKFRVTPAVLIPRPETEELIDVAKSLFPAHNPLTVLDVGTGSGCIGITLKLEMPYSQVLAMDISHDALAVARHNAKAHQADIVFVPCDFLNEEPDIHNLDLIISNPPYIAHHEISSIKPNVKDFEPHLALFVPDSDPLVFYRALAKKGKHLLKHNGWIVAEIHELRGKETASVFKAEGYEPVYIVRDLSGKDRVVISRNKQAGPLLPRKDRVTTAEQARPAG